MFLHQELEWVEDHPFAAVLLDMGLGKTSITLTAIADLLFDSFEVHKVLVIAPLRVARDTWSAELQKWDQLHHLTYSVARISSSIPPICSGVSRTYTLKPSRRNNPCLATCKGLGSLPGALISEKLRNYPSSTVTTHSNS